MVFRRLPRVLPRLCASAPQFHHPGKGARHCKRVLRAQRNADIRRVCRPPRNPCLLCAKIPEDFPAIRPGRASYYTSQGFWKYLAANLTFLNFLSPTLPGVFETHSVNAVNSSLWTMKVEVMFYAAAPAIAWLSRRFRPLWVIAALYVLSVAYAEFFTHLYHVSGVEKYDVLRRQLPGQMMYFAAGMAAVHLRAALLRHKAAALPAGLAVWGLCSAFSQLRPIEPLAIACAITVVAYGSRRLSALSASVPNLTYEVFLLHFPILQTFVELKVFERLGFATALISAFVVIILLSAAINRTVSKQL